MNLHFKICSGNDLDTLVDISQQTFIHAYASLNDPENFREFIDNTFSKEALAKELEHPEITFYFVFDTDTLVGYLKINEGNAQTEQFHDSCLELERIYVLPEFQGRGIGKQMLHKVIAIAKYKQLEYVWLGVWQVNTNAVRFYKREGFEIFDTHYYIVGNDKQTDWLMKYELA